MKRSSSNVVSFKWKKKCNNKLTNTETVFSETDDIGVNNVNVYCHAIEDTSTLSLRLKNEGNVLAESERYWEAISKFQQAIEYNLDALSKCDCNINNSFTENISCNLSLLYELSSQCYCQVGEIYPAVNAAQKAVGHNSKCPISLLSLSRAQVNIGELYLAKSNIERSLHLSPVLADAWDDLNYVNSLIEELNSKTFAPLPIFTRPGIICQRETDKN